jgi:uncharacterized protein
VGRPVKWRRVNQMPPVLNFAPSNQGESIPGENTLLIEEYEAIRLKDLEGLEQEECAEHMQISRPTFQRILMTARQKVADSLIHGKGIRIEGGNFKQKVCLVRCLDCGRQWEESYETLAQEKSSLTCPSCHSGRMICAPPESCIQGRSGRNRFCQRSCRRYGWNDPSNLDESERETHAEHHHPG